MENCPEFIFLWLGLAKAGIICALINTNLPATSLMHTLQVSKAKMLIAGDSMLPTLKSLEELLARNPPGTCTNPLLQLWYIVTSEEEHCRQEDGFGDGGRHPSDVLPFASDASTSTFSTAAISPAARASIAMVDCLCLNHILDASSSMALPESYFMQGNPQEPLFFIYTRCGSVRRLFACLLSLPFAY
jgi:acyl-CoA synthetase (AMP-forming)/AMP-acid ligase II